ncbi:MAG TPA: HEAT repeat domain-containing protein [Tepidisphaeraceae bacterium]|nr:HEAT repeat domain-containing protein [Tepidisphaeraceae bacterium]
MGLSGCQGGKPDPRTGRVLPAPKLPPAYPQSRDVPLDSQLQTAAHTELHTDLHNQDPNVRAHAVEELQRSVGKDAEAEILEALSDRQALVRYAAGMAAGQLKLKAGRDQYEKMLDDPDRVVRVVAHFDLHQIGDYRHSHELEKLSRDPEPQVRGTTAQVLGLIGDPSAVKVLRPMRHDSHPAVRQQAAASLWRLGDEQGLADLIGYTLSQFQDDQMFALISLSAPHKRVVIQHVRNGLVTDSPQVNLTAARAMGMLGCDEGYGVARGSVKSQDPSLRLLSAMAFGMIGRSDAQDVLRGLLADPDPNVRVAAAGAILELRPHFISECSPNRG